MALQKAVKSYPMVKWFLVASAVLVVVGLLMSGLATDPNSADTMTFLLFLGAAVVLPFLALAFPRRQVVTMELPSDSLAGKGRAELQGILDALEESKRKGEITPERYENARGRILAAMKGK